MRPRLGPGCSNFQTTALLPAGNRLIPFFAVEAMPLTKAPWILLSHLAATLQAVPFVKSVCKAVVDEAGGGVHERQA